MSRFDFAAKREKERRGERDEGREIESEQLRELVKKCRGKGGTVRDGGVLLVLNVTLCTGFIRVQI